MSRRLAELDKRLRALEESRGRADEPSNILLYPMGISEEGLSRMIEDKELEIRAYRQRVRPRSTDSGAVVIMPIKGSYIPALDNNKDTEEQKQ